jgi:outer membrane protein assembly factor BamB
MKKLTIAFALAVFSLSAFAADWPQFRGPTGQGTSTATALPTHWSQTQNIVWKLPIPGGGWSSPILWNHRVYLTTAVNEGGSLSLRAVCIDARAGKVLWNTEVLPARAVQAHQKNSHASPTPICDGQKLYVHFGQYGSAALDLSGNVLWRNTSLKYPPVHGNGGSPALIADKLIFNCDGAKDPFVVALNKTTGELLWKTARETPAAKKFSFSTPLGIQVNGATQVISPASGAVFSYDPKTGSEIWRVLYGQGYSVVPRPVFGHGLVFVSSGFDRAVLYAIRPTGKGDVTGSHVAWKIDRGAPKTPSPVLVGDELYFVSDEGMMSCVDAKTGTLHWQERLGGNHSSSLIAANGFVYAQNEEGVATVVKAGKIFEMVAKNDLKERTLASWAVDDRDLYIRTENNLYRIQEPIPAR